MFFCRFIHLDWSLWSVNDETLSLSFHGSNVLCSGDMVIYAGGQQPFQRVNVGSNVMQATFTVTAWTDQPVSALIQLWLHPRPPWESSSQPSPDPLFAFCFSALDPAGAAKSITNPFANSPSLVYVKNYPMWTFILYHVFSYYFTSSICLCLRYSLPFSDVVIQQTY